MQLVAGRETHVRDAAQNLLGSELLQSCQNRVVGLLQSCQKMFLFSVTGQKLLIDRNIVINLQMICRSEKSRGWGA